MMRPTSLESSNLSPETRPETLVDCDSRVGARLPCSRLTYTDLQPSQAIRPQRLGISKLQQAPRQVGPQVVQVGVHGVGPPPEVQVVGEVEPILMHVIVCYLKKKKESFTRMLPEEEERKRRKRCTDMPPEEEGGRFTCVQQV